MADDAAVVDVPVTPEIPAAAVETPPVVETPPETGAEKKPGEAQNVDDLPPWQKALISKEKTARQTAEAKAAEFERMLAQQMEMNARLAAQHAPKPAPDKPEPRPEQFDSDEAYQEARTNWRAERIAAEKLAQREREEATKREHQEAVSAQLRFAASVAATKAKYADFEAVAWAPNVPITEPMAKEIRQSQNGAEVAYWLGKHLDEAHRIAALPPAAITREIARIEGRIEAAAASPSIATKPTVSKAPEPVRTVGSSNVVEPNLYTMSADQVYDHLQRQKAQRRR